MGPQGTGERCGRSILVGSFRAGGPTLPVETAHEVDPRQTHGGGGVVAVEGVVPTTRQVEGDELVGTDPEQAGAHRRSRVVGGRSPTELAKAVVAGFDLTRLETRKAVGATDKVDVDGFGAPGLAAPPQGEEVRKMEELFTKGHGDALYHPSPSPGVLGSERAPREALGRLGNPAAKKAARTD